MSGLRQVLLGFLAVLISGLIIVGALTLSLSEREQGTAAAPSQTRQTTVSKDETKNSTVSPTVSPAPSDASPSTEETAAPTNETPPSPAPTESSSDTQADAITATPAEVEGNEEHVYLSLLPGAFMEVPYEASILILQEEVEPTPSVTEQATDTKSKSCEKPRGWVAYTVRRGDTLSRLSQRTGVSVSRLKKVNCLESNKLKAGKTIFIPRLVYASYVWRPNPLLMQPPLYYNPPRKPQAVERIQPVVVVTMPP